MYNLIRFLTWLGLQEALQKMEDYMNEEMALKDTLSRISREMEGKIDNDSLKLMKDYFGEHSDTASEKNTSNLTLPNTAVYL